jgi:hypothetical protein
MKTIIKNKSNPNLKNNNNNLKEQMREEQFFFFFLGRNSVPCHFFVSQMREEQILRRKVMS